MKTILYLFAISFTVVSCEKVIQLELDDSDPVVVVEGNITTESAPYTIKLTRSKNYFEDKGYQFFNWKKYCPELFSIENYLSKNKPSKLAILNINKAKTIYKYFKNADVGQSVIVQNQLILGIEAIEGTDKLIERCFNYKRKGDRGILVKFSKKNQSNLIDIPLVGLDTIKNIKKFDYEGLVLERDKCLIVDKEKVIDYANKNNIFIKSEVF